MQGRSSLTTNLKYVHTMAHIALSLLMTTGQAARTMYVEEQEAIRQELELKKLEKEGGKLIDEILWGIPRGCMFI